MERTDGGTFARLSKQVLFISESSDTIRCDAMSVKKAKNITVTERVTSKGTQFVGEKQEFLQFLQR